MSIFTGFPQDLYTFLTDLSRNNNREWFNQNKSRYQESVLEPMRAFIIAMGQPLDAISENFLADERTNGGSMFRIYRDTRFSKDKRPYKENVGCQFRHVAGKSAHAPGFYVHLQPDNVFIGGGIWMPPNPVLDKIRRAIVNKPKDWAEVVKLKEKFSGDEGESLKRPPTGYEADHPYINDIKRKSFFLMREMDPGQALKPTFIDEAARTFSDISPLMAFITNALKLPY